MSSRNNRERKVYIGNLDKDVKRSLYRVIFVIEMASSFLRFITLNHPKKMFVFYPIL